MHFFVSPLLAQRLSSLGCKHHTQTLIWIERRKYKGFAASIRHLFFFFIYIFPLKQQQQKCNPQLQVWARRYQIQMHLVPHQRLHAAWENPNSSSQFSRAQIVGHRVATQKRWCAEAHTDLLLWFRKEQASCCMSLPAPWSEGCTAWPDATCVMLSQLHMLIMKHDDGIQ